MGDIENVCDAEYEESPKAAKAYVPPWSTPARIN